MATPQEKINWCRRFRDVLGISRATVTVYDRVLAREWVQVKRWSGAQRKKRGQGKFARRRLICFDSLSGVPYSLDCGSAKEKKGTQVRNC